MGHQLRKAGYHLGAAIKRTAYRILYGRQLRMGKGVTFRRHFQLTIERDARVDIGDGCFFNNGCSINALAQITIGDRSIFGEHVLIYDHNHRFRDPDTPIAAQGFATAPVTIGADCWIGSNVTILKGVSIGSRCVIGAGCLITTDIPANSIVRSAAGLRIEPIAAPDGQEEQA